jgi:hypothetical protein
MKRKEIHFSIVREETIEVNKKERVTDDEKAKKKKVLNQREGGLESIQPQLSSWSCLGILSCLPCLRLPYLLWHLSLSLTTSLGFHRET